MEHGQVIDFSVGKCEPHDRCALHAVSDINVRVHHTFGTTRRSRRVRDHQKPIGIYGSGARFQYSIANLIAARDRFRPGERAGELIVTDEYNPV